MSKRTALLGIMDENDFKMRTKATTAVGGFVSKFKSRGGDMAAIDLALENWTRDCDSKIAGSAKLGLVAAIATACDQWFALKARTGKSTALSQARSQVIAEVRRSCQKAQQYLKNVATAESKTRPGMAGVKRAGTKALGAGYSHERTDYLASGKTSNPYSVSAVEESGQHASGMSYQQFTAAAAGSGGARVEFLDRKQRLEHLVTIQGGLMYQNGELLDADIGQTHVRVNGVAATVPKVYMDTYAVDKYGNIYSKRLKGIQDLYFNHSSYCSGKSVICAGTMGCIQGRLIYVSNFSGHYKPNAGYLSQFLRILAEEGVDLSHVLVEAMDTKKSMKALTLLKSPSAASDWPHWDGNDVMVMVGGKMGNVANPQ